MKRGDLVRSERILNPQGDANAFQSEKQRRYLWANEPEIARDWTDTYGSRIDKNSGGIARLGLFDGSEIYKGIAELEGSPIDYLGSRSPITYPNEYDPGSTSGYSWNLGYPNWENTVYDPAFGELSQYDKWDTDYPGSFEKRGDYNIFSQIPRLQPDNFYKNFRPDFQEEVVEEEPSGIELLSNDFNKNYQFEDANWRTKGIEKTKAGAEWLKNLALTAGGKLIDIPLGLANFRNPLSERSSNYNPDLQGQIDMLKASGILGGGDPSGPYRITGGPLAGKNLVSGFGTNDYGRMLQKRIEYFRQQKAKKGKLTDEQNRRLREAEDAKRKADAAKAARTTHPVGGRKTQGNVGGWSATSTSSGSGQGGGYGTGTGYTDKSSVSSGGWKW